MRRDRPSPRRRPWSDRDGTSDGRGDAGYSLVELMITMAVMGVVLALIFPIITTVTAVTSSANSSSNANAEARNALQQLTVDIGSTNANNVCFPSSAQLAVSTTCPSGGTTYGNSLRALSDIYGSCQWMQWTVDPTTSMLTQTTWPRTWTSASGTPLPVTVAGPVANVSSVLYPVFSMATTPVSSGSAQTTSLVNIQLYLKGSTGTAIAAARYSNTATQYVFLQTSVSVLSSILSAGSC